MTERRSSDSKTGQYTVLYDGHCRVCTGSTRWIRRLDSKQRFTYATQQDHGDAPPVCHDELRLRCPDGTVLAGWSAVATIARMLPLTAWFGLIASAGPLHYLGTRFYRWFARNRYRFGGDNRDTRSGGQR